jgi:hypothetical protein
VRPLDATEQCAETAGSLAVDAFDQSNAPGEVCAKVWVAGAVLDVGSGADAVGEDGLQLVEILAREVAALIDDKPGEMLAYARTHETGLAVMDMEAFFHSDGSDPGGEACGVLYECLIAGEGEERFGGIRSLLPRCGLERPPSRDEYQAAKRHAKSYIPVA